MLADQVVLLDLRRSKYLSVSCDQWSGLVGEQTLPMPDQTTRRHGRFDARVCGRLAGLLEPDLTAGVRQREADVFTVEPADSSWSQPLTGVPNAAKVWSAWHLVHAAAWSAYTLRRHSLLHTAASITRTTAGLQHAEANTHPLLDQAVATFHRLRPLLYTSRDRCLQDSLTLVRFLASEGIAVRCVIGVKSAPFAAHAWVQAGGLVLNDLHDNVRHYKPILVV